LVKNRSVTSCSGVIDCCGGVRIGSDAKFVATFSNTSERDPLPVLPDPHRIEQAVDSLRESGLLILDASERYACALFRRGQSWSL
jgi:hypothetical protein